MDKPHLKPSKGSLKTLVLAGAMILTPMAALATYPVFDATSFTKLTEQFNQLTKQLDELMEQTEILGKISKKAQDQINAIGKMGRFTLPIANLAKLGMAVNKDARCLLPNLSGLMPSLNFDELNWESICAKRRFYQDTLWFDPNDPDSWTFNEGTGPEDWSVPDGGSWGGSGGGDWKNPDTPAEKRQYRAARDIAREQARVRQDVLTIDAITTGLAQADQIVDQVEVNEKTIEEIEAQADVAEDVKQLLVVLIKAQLHQDRQDVQAQQQRAQMIRLQAATLMKLMPPGATLAEAMDGVEVEPEEGGE